MIDDEIKVENKTFDEQVIETKSFELESADGKELLYLAVRHSTDPKFGQHSVMENRFLNFKPDLLLYEGPENPLVDTNRDESIARYGGEMGLARWLVNETNKNLKPEEKQIEAKSFDLTSEDWIKGFRDGGYSNEDIALFDISRRVYREATNAVKNGEDLNIAEEKFEKEFAEPSLQGNLTYELSLLPRADEQMWTLNLLRKEYKEKTGQDLSFQNNNEESIDTSYTTTLKEMFDFELSFKDKIMSGKIIEALKTNNKVMVVAGSGHAIAQKPIIEEHFSK